MNGGDFLSSANGITWSQINAAGLRPPSGSSKTSIVLASASGTTNGNTYYWGAGSLSDGPSHTAGTPALWYKPCSSLNSTWTKAAISGVPSSSSTMELSGVAVNANTVVVGNRLGGLYYSTNLGATFSTGVGTSNSGMEVNRIIWSGTMFLAARKDGRIYRSNDGVTWAFTQVDGASILDVTHLNGTYLAITSSKLFRSTDGINWTQITGPAGLPAAGPPPPRPPVRRPAAPRATRQGVKSVSVRVRPVSPPIAQLKPSSSLNVTTSERPPSLYFWIVTP